MSRNTLGQRFAWLFSDPAAQEMLRRLGTRLPLPTFTLTSTSLRNLRRVFVRLEDINGGRIGSHGNFVSDPASLGLVDNSVEPPVLTPAGRELLSYKSTLSGDTARAEYRLLKILYFSNYRHEQRVQDFLEGKQNHLLNVLRQINVSRSELLSQPKLLVITELIASFPGALPRFLTLSNNELIRLADLGEQGFQTLCSGPGFPQGLSSLCRRIGNDYTRAEERRLHSVVSMALLNIAQNIPPGGTRSLQVPSPYSNLLSEQDIFELHAKYTSDISVWFDGVGYQVSASMTSLGPVAALDEIAPLRNVGLQPQANIPTGTGRAAANHQSRNTRRAAQRERIPVNINPLLSEDAEDYVEKMLLQPQYGERVIRAGHRSGEMIALLDGMIPGADFYVTDAENNPIEFIEIKNISGRPPTNIFLTRAEYLRARRCFEQGVPYRVILVDLADKQCYEVNDFARQIANLSLEEVIQFTVKVGESFSGKTPR